MEDQKIPVPVKPGGRIIMEGEPNTGVLDGTGIYRGDVDRFVPETNRLDMSTGHGYMDIVETMEIADVVDIINNV